MTEELKNSADTRDSIAPQAKERCRSRTPGPKPQQRFGKGAFWFILTSHKGTPDYYAHSVVVSYLHDGLFYGTLVAIA